MTFAIRLGSGAPMRCASAIEAGGRQSRTTRSKLWELKDQVTSNPWVCACGEMASYSDWHAAVGGRLHPRRMRRCVIIAQRVVVPGSASQHQPLRS